MGCSGQALVLFLIFINLVGVSVTETELEFPMQHCYDGGNYSSNSTYRRNLETLLSSLSSHTEITHGFYNFSAGEEPDRVYVYALCRGDITPEDCRTRINSSSIKLFQNCSGHKDAFGWYEKSFIRYSDKNMYGIMDSDPYMYLFSPQDLSKYNQTEFYVQLTTLLNNLRDEAASGDSRRKFASGSIPATTFLTIYALSQCTPDLSREDCLRCLDIAAQQIPECCDSRQGTRIGQPSCYIRFETNIFFRTMPRSPGPPLALVPPGSPPSNGKVLAIVVPIVAFAALMICIIGILRERKKRSKAQKAVKYSNINEAPLKSKNRHFSYSEVVDITDNFKTVIGEGGFGKVFHGVLADETQVAVKLLSKSSNQGNKEFRSEAQLLMVVHHRNLVSLVGYCDEDEHKALIYEYMANGNVRQHLSEKGEKVLSWRKRLEVAVDSAQGLEYLHNGCKPPIIHRDLKTSNILLDTKMTAKIADFGLSRAFATESDSHVSTNLAGTPGYVDPEAHASGNLNKKSDVYSFGIILFELITGQPAIIRGAENSIHILQWINPVIGTGDIGYIMDPRLQGDFNINSAWKAVEVAMSSCVPSSTQRPDMSHVLAELKESLEIEVSSGKTLILTNMDERNRKRSSDSLVSMATDDNTAPYAR